MLHHQLALRPEAPFYPPGIARSDGDPFLDALAAAQPRSLVTSGHTHRHRRRTHGPVTVTTVGSTKDYPGTWAGYVAHDDGSAPGRAPRGRARLPPLDRGHPPRRRPPVGAAVRGQPGRPLLHARLGLRIREKSPDRGHVPGDAPSFTTWRGRGRRALLFTGATFLAFPLALIPPRPPGGGGFLLLAAVVFVAVAPEHHLRAVAPPAGVDEAHDGRGLLPRRGPPPALGRRRQRRLRAAPAAARSSGRPSTAGPSTSRSRWPPSRPPTSCPIVLIGGEAYPVSGLRAATLSSLTFTVAAVTVQQLLARIRRHEEMLGVGGRAAREASATRRTSGGAPSPASNGSPGPMWSCSPSSTAPAGCASPRRPIRPMVARGRRCAASWRIVLERGEQQFAARTDHDAAAVPVRAAPADQPGRHAASPW